MRRFSAYIILSLTTLEPALAAAGHGADWYGNHAVDLSLSLVTVLYAAGLYRLWGRAGIGRGVTRWQAAAFAAGLLALALALHSPLEAAAAVLFSRHMVQHLILMVIAPPLLVMGAAEVVLLWSLPTDWRRGLVRWADVAGRAIGGEWGLSVPAAVVILAAAALWFWHLPALYDLALRNEAVHAAEHGVFLATSLLFWIAILRLRPRDHARNGVRIVFVTAMGLQGSLLGALLTLASTPLYDAYRASTAALGRDPLTDQQLAGLIMWVPPSLLYLGVSAWLFVHWLDALGRRSGRAPPPAAASRDPIIERSSMEPGLERPALEP